MAIQGAVVALLASALALVGSGPAGAQQPVTISVKPKCGVIDAIDLGTLGDAVRSTLTAEGRWTTTGCDSRWRVNSDATTYRFNINRAGRIRIDLESDDADAYLYLLANDGTRLTEDDDSRGIDLNARIERDLQPGSFLIEATTNSGRARGPANFTLTVSRPAGCEIRSLGNLRSGGSLTAKGSWTLDSCDSRIRDEHPGQSFSFGLPSAARVRVDLESETGDPFLLVAPLGTINTRHSDVILNDDDDGNRYNSRIEAMLRPGNYLIEALTYGKSDHEHPVADFTLTVRIVNDKLEQAEPLIKLEQVSLPSVVVAGDPIDIHYRIGNLGGGTLPAGSYSRVYVVGRGVFESSDDLPGKLWAPGKAFHSGAAAAGVSSKALDELTPFNVTFGRSGESWLFLAIVTFDADDEEIAYHRHWNDLVVLTAPTFGPTEVRVAGVTYTVRATAGAEGKVSTSVSPAAYPGIGAHPVVRARATYTAGVRTQLLDGVFDRPALAGLTTTAAPRAVSVPNPSSTAMMQLFAARLAEEVGASGIAAGVAAHEAISPVAVENLVLGYADGAAAEYASLAASWRDLLKTDSRSTPLSYTDALGTQAQLAYAETVLAPAVAAGKIVRAARAADDGWDDEDVQSMMAGLRGDCENGEPRLAVALPAFGVAASAGAVVLDAPAVRTALPLVETLVGGVICRASSVDALNLRLLARLGLGGNEELGERIARADALEIAPTTVSLRLVARLGDDGRIALGVQLADGERILPTTRYLPAQTDSGVWYTTSDVSVADSAIGQILARRGADGRVELAFRTAGGERVSPASAFLPTSVPAGTWLRSGSIDVPR